MLDFNHYIKNPIFAILAIIIICLSLLCIACEPEAPFEIKNETKLTLKIYIACSATEHVRLENERELKGEVNPGEILKPRNIIQAFNSYLIIAKDAQGSEVYSKEYSIDELNNRQWKVIIPNN